MAFVQRVVYQDIPEKNIKNGIAILPHQQNTPLPVHEWRDIAQSVPPEGMIRMIYHLKADITEPVVPTAENCWHVAMSPHRGEDTAVSFRHVDNMVSTFANGGKPVIPEGYKPTLEPEGNVYTHCGSETFGRHLFRPVSNSRHDKPDGGFWASANDAPYSWSEWASAEMSEEYRSIIPQQVEFTVAPGAKIFQINTVDDLAYLAAIYPMPHQYSELKELGLGDVCIDWQAMAMNWDGMTYNYGNLGNSMAAMDCDSVCIFNPNVIQCINPEQDISQPKTQEESRATLYAIEFIDIRDMAQPGWLSAQPPYNAANMHLYTSDYAFYMRDALDTPGAKQLDWGKQNGVQVYEAAVMYKVQLPDSVAQQLQERIDCDRLYLTTIPITSDMIIEPAKVKFWPSTFAYGRETTLQDAPARAGEIAALTEFAIPQWKTLDKDAKDWCDFMHASVCLETLYGTQGLATRGYQPEDPSWQKPLCEMAQQLHESALPFDTKLRLAKAMDEVLTNIERCPTEKAALMNYKILVRQMAKEANANYEPQFGMQVQAWTEKLAESPEEFTPQNEEVSL